MSTPAEQLRDHLVRLNPSLGWVTDEIAARNIARRAVAEWLRGLTDGGDWSWLPVDHYQTEDHRDVVGRALSALADEIGDR